MRKLWGSLFIAALVALFPLQAYPFKKGGILNVTSVGEPRLLNPVFDDSPQARDIYNHIFSGLVSSDERGELLPDLATHVPTLTNGGVMVRDDGTMVVTYTLRDRVTWHDGEPLTADDIYFTWQMHTDPRIKYPATPGYDRITRVETVNKRTAKVYFDRLYRDYTSLFRYILPKHAFRSRHFLFNEKHPFNRHPIGTGPYVFKEWKDGQLILDANPRYFLGKAFLDQMRYQFKSDDLRLIPRAAEWVDPTHLLRHLSILSYQYLRERQDIDIKVLPSYQIEHLDFNLSNPLLADIRIRRAIAYAIDRWAISRLFYGLAEPAFGAHYKQSWKYNPIVERFYAFDPAKSEDLLDSAGWALDEENFRTDKQGAPLSLILVAIQGNKSHLLVSEYLKKALGEVGIELQVDFVPVGKLFSEILPRGQYEIALYPWDSGPTADNYPIWHSQAVPPKGRNFTRFNDYNVDRLLDEMKGTVDFAVLEKHNHRLAEIVAEMVPALPLYYDPNIEISKRVVHNFRPNMHDGSTWNSYEWWIE